MSRVLEELPGRARLHEQSRVHDVHALAHAGDHAEVVHDEDEGGVLLGDQLPQKVEDLSLDRHVERSRRLVSDPRLRLAGEGHRDHRALAHPAREVRVVADARLRARDADAVDQLGGALLGVLAAQAEVLLERLT